MGLVAGRRVELGRRDARIVEVRSPDFGPSEIRAGQRGAAAPEVRIRQVGLVEIGIGQQGVAEFRIRQVGLIEARAVNVAPPKLAFVRF